MHLWKTVFLKPRTPSAAFISVFYSLSLHARPLLAWSVHKTNNTCVSPHLKQIRCFPIHFNVGSLNEPWRALKKKMQKLFSRKLKNFSEKHSVTSWADCVELNNPEGGSTKTLICIRKLADTATQIASVAAVPDLVWMTFNSWVFECVSIFQGTFVVINHRLYCLAPGFLMSTVFLWLQHWTFRAPLTDSRQHAATSEADVEGPKLSTSERCHVTKETKRSSLSQIWRHGVKIQWAQPWITCHFFPFFFN